MGIWPIHAESFVQLDVATKHSKRGTRDVPGVTFIGVIESEFIDDKDASVCRKRRINARRQWAGVREAGCCYEGENHKKYR
jgi:hypothetical protein